MIIVAGIGVEVSAAEVHAVAVDATGAVVGQQRVAGVRSGADLAATLRRVAGALATHREPVRIALAWDDGRDGNAPIDLGRAGPVEVAAQLRRWAAAGRAQIAVGVDERGGRWSVALGSHDRLGDAVELAAARAGLSVIGSEPVATARARRPGLSAAHAMGLVAAGRLAPPTRVDVPPGSTTLERRTWVIERVDDDDRSRPPAAPSWWRRVAAGLRRAVAMVRRRD